MCTDTRYVRGTDLMASQLEKMRWLLVPWKIKEEPFWRNYFAHVFVVKSVLLDGHEDDAMALAHAGAPVHEGRRRTVTPAGAAANAGATTARPPPPASSPLAFESALASLDDDLDAAVSGTGGGATGNDSVVELSSMDGLSLEEQINAALADD